MRQAKITRTTNETDISLTLRLHADDARGTLNGSSGIAFLDHMLNAVCVHGHMDMDLTMRGDLAVDGHHSVEDLGIVLGQAFARAVKGAPLTRYGESMVPMDESLSRCVLDISGRPYLVYRAEFTNAAVGALDTCLAREFFYAFAINAGITLHLENLYGENDHHKLESLFKAFARALYMAARPISGEVLSTKGVL